jgi:predicted RNA methylase
MSSNLTRALALLPALSLVAHGLVAAQARSASEDYEPKVGQPGKDIVWVPTPDELVEHMLEMAGVGASDYVIDLGSGDGRVVIAAAEKFGARGLGIEYNPDLIALSSRNAEIAGVAHRVDFVQGDLFETDLSKGTVFTLYLSPGLNMKLRPKLLELRPGTRVVSHTFTMAAWQPDDRVTIDGASAYLWIVPTKVMGEWQLTTKDDDETWSLALEQEFQRISGRVRLADETFDIQDGRVRGTEIHFRFVDASGTRRELSGRAVGDRMDGILRIPDGTSVTWSAVPTAPSQSSEYSPKLGQIGKDVIWVPTPDALVEQMLKMARVGPDDFVIDLGSGDGRTVIAAAQKFGARGRGIEYDPNLVEYSIRQAELAGVADKVEFVEADIFESDFSQATVLTMYLLPSLNLKLRHTILDMAPGTRVVSHSFDMANWRADQSITVESRTAYLWIVPARLAGNWRLTLPTEGSERTWALSLEQEFQILSGQVHLPDGWFAVFDGLVRGTEFRFRVIDASDNRREISGRVFGNRMEGTIRNADGTELRFSGERAEESRARSDSHPASGVVLAEIR